MDETGSDIKAVKPRLTVSGVCPSMPSAHFGELLGASRISSTGWQARFTSPFYTHLIQATQIWSGAAPVGLHPWEDLTSKPGVIPHQPVHACCRLSPQEECADAGHALCLQFPGAGTLLSRSSQLPPTISYSPCATPNRALVPRRDKGARSPSALPNVSA
jgi:hypothetical protein